MNAHGRLVHARVLPRLEELEHSLILLLPSMLHALRKRRSKQIRRHRSFVASNILPEPRPQLLKHTLVACSSSDTYSNLAQLCIVRALTLAVLVAELLNEGNVESAAVCVELGLDVRVLLPGSDNNAEVVGDTLPDEVCGKVRDG